jgi:hypothetical protein
MNRHYRYNWLRSPFDARDHKFMYSKTGAPRPQKLLPDPSVGLAYDQGQEGSCTANAIARVVRALGVCADPSRQFIYDGERLEEHVALTKDSGAFGRDGAKLLHKVGVCTEHTFPYTPGNMKHKPPQAAYDEAAQHRISGYRHVYSVDGLLDALASGHMVPFGFEVPESFESDEVAHTGVLQLPKKGEKSVGGHEVVACGFDLEANVIFCGNSWGDDWGMRLKLSDGVERGGFSRCRSPTWPARSSPTTSSCWRGEVILREAPMRELVARRDELRTQIDALDAEIARRAREEFEAQQREHEMWGRLKPRPMLQRGTPRW